MILCVISSIAAMFVACQGTENSSSNDESSVDTSVSSSQYLTLDAYTITMYADETYTLNVKKYDVNGIEQTIASIEYVSEAEKILTVSDGVITAIRAGETYVQIKADGLSIACFVTVVNGSRESGFEIRLVENCLHKGLPAQAFVYVFNDGKTAVFDGNVSWSVEDEKLLSIENDGTVTALAVSESATFYAKFTFEGQEYTLEKTISVEEPYVYFADYNNVKLAALKTPSGQTNKQYVQASVSITRKNPITGEEKVMEGKELTVSVVDETLLTASVSDDGKVTFNSVSCGKTMGYVSINGTANLVGISLEVVTPISSIADMDLLALASHNDYTLLSQSYMLVNDIDYEGKIIYPIAIFRENANRVLGIQWKYLLQSTEEKVKIGSVEFPKYKFVNRENVGKKVAGQEYCYGLSEEEFKFLAYNGGINSAYRAFSGTFDGNGYSIKNAVTMYDSMIVLANGVYYGSNSSIFGEANGATFKNIGFENITKQNLNDFTAEDSEYGLNRLFEKGTSVGTSKITDGVLLDKYRGFGVIARTKNCELSNMFVDVVVTNTASLGYNVPNGILQNYATNCVTKNCVVSVHGETHKATNAFNGAHSSQSGTFENNLAIGVSNAETNILNGQEGQNGNLWCKAESWATLKQTATGAKAVNAKSFEEILTTFSSQIWDMTELQKNGGAPRLNRECSVLN